MAANIFASGAQVSRCFDITGIVVVKRQTGPRTYSLLIVPATHYRTSRKPAGIWLYYEIPRNDFLPQYDFIHSVNLRYSYTFTVVPANSNLENLFLRIINIKTIRRADRYELSDCKGQFGVAGFISQIYPHGVMVLTRALQANQTHDYIPAGYIYLETREPWKYQVDQEVIFRVEVSADGYSTRNNKNFFKARARIVEESVLMQTPKCLHEQFETYKTFKRCGHWRRSKNGTQHWVKECIVHRKIA